MPSLHSHSAADSRSLRDCIAACSHCHAMCEQAFFQHCLPTGGRHVEPEHLKLMADCAQICRTSADFMLRGSPRHALTCRICAEICDACAGDCERIGGMEDCADACRKCAKSCREMT